MKNKEIADVLREIADFLEIREVEYKPRAYRTAARNVESLSEGIEDVHERGGLEECRSVVRRAGPRAQRSPHLIERDERPFAGRDPLGVQHSLTLRKRRDRAPLHVVGPLRDAGREQLSSVGPGQVSVVGSRWRGTHSYHPCRITLARHADV
jgi:hypothetical protein